MIDISIKDLNKYYGANHVIKGISFEINSGEKVGLLGKNGCGKTTLFKTITGEEEFESGTISKASGKKIEMLAQIPVFGANETAEDILRSSFAELTEIYKNMKAIEGIPEPKVLERYGRLLEEYENLGGYDMEVKIDKVCSGMNLDGRLRSSFFENLSGGEKVRVNLARILLRDCDILLLDEPTNHLDLVSLEWFENFLRDFLGTVVVISHDRVFLDQVVTRIIEIDKGKANFYSGNYSFYIEERRQRYLTQAEEYKQQQRKINQLETAIKRQRVWAQMNPSNTGLAKRALAMEKRIEQMDKVEKPAVSRRLSGEFSGGGYASKEIISFDSAVKSYGKKNILDNLNLKVHRKDSIALIGANGCGKSTLLKIITGEENLDSGEMKISPSVNIGYMAQIIDFIGDGSSGFSGTVLDTLRNEIDVSEEIARSILARFHFKAADVMKKTSALSGGEKSRLKLCIMMQKNINFLLLDEPTNHLDIESREWIENAISDFEGTILFVSHDRYFLNKFADKIWDMENGSIIQYDCGFEEYTEIAKKSKSSPKTAKKKTPKAKAIPQKPAKPTAETMIKQAEAELNLVDKEIDVGLVSGDYSRIAQLQEKRERILEQIDILYEKWFYGEES